MPENYYKILYSLVFEQNLSLKIYKGEGKTIPVIVREGS
jgi:hypothetical protein